MICLLLVTDGREDYLQAAVDSALQQLAGNVTRRVMYDDTGDAGYRRSLAERFPTFEHINAGPRQGFGGAIRAAWDYLSFVPERFIAHVEQDFVFERPVVLDDMAAVLDSHPHLAQLCLRRQPWNEHERLAGGIVEQHPDAYTDCEWSGHQWLEHRLCFSTNPCIYRRSLCVEAEWPEGTNSEGHFTHSLIQSDPDLRFGYWGKRSDSPWVTHIGRERVGSGY